LPQGLLPDGTDGATADLAELVRKLRQQHGGSGIQG